MKTTINKNTINAYQSTSIKGKIDEIYKGIDLNYIGYNHLKDNKSNTFVKEGIDASLNRCLLWLASKPYDYIREDFKGGTLYLLLGQLNQESNFEEWKSLLTSRFNEEFSNDLEIIDLTITPDQYYRKITIDMIVRDKIENKVFSVITEASK